MKNILIWGTGIVARQFQKNFNKCNIVGYVVTEINENIYNGLPVFTVDKISVKYDYIFIATSAIYHASIWEQCINNNIGEDSICFARKSSYVVNVAHNLQIAKEIFDIEGYERICVEFGKREEDWILKDAEQWTKLNNRKTMEIKKEYMCPIYRDKIKNAGNIDSYFWQDLWAARKIYCANPSIHYDIGSRVDGFIGHLLAFRDNVNLIDIRPLDRAVDGLNFTQSDAVLLDNIKDCSIESLSALCSLEHFGMGRYGDVIDPEACYKCFRMICKKLKTGGNIYLGIPVGKEHIEFNAHRVFYASTIVNEFSDCELLEYSCTYDGYIEYNVPLNKYDNDLQLGGNRFGLFHLMKK